MWVGEGSKLRISGSLFLKNHAKKGGGAIAAVGSFINPTLVVLSSTKFDQNRAFQWSGGGGIFANNDVKLVLEDVTMASNSPNGLICVRGSKYTNDKTKCESDLCKAGRTDSNLFVRAATICCPGLGKPDKTQCR